MKKFVFSLLSILLMSLTVLPFAFAADTDTPAAAVKSVDDFKDLKNLPQADKDKFDSLIQDGVFNGLTEDTFGLDARMNRAQFAKVAAIIFNLEVDDTLTVSSFTDVRSDDPANSYALPYIEALKKAGLTNGYDAEGKTYKPAGDVSRQELAAFLIRGLGLDDEAASATPVDDSTVDDWAKGYVSLALEKNLLANQSAGKFSGKTSATRKMLALASFAAKQILSGSEPEQTEEPEVKPETGKDPAAPAGEISAQGKKLLFITRQSSQMTQLKDNPDDEKIIGRLKDLGFRVTWVNCDKFTADKADGYDLVFVSNTLNSKYLRSGIMKDIAIPTVYLKNHGMYYLGLSSQEENTNEYNIKSTTIAEPKDKAAAGLSGEVDLLLTTDPKTAMAYGLPGKDATVIATVPGKPKEATIFYYNKGTHSDSGYEVQARLSFFSFAGNYDNATEDSWKLLDALVLWTLQNG
ncbi:S-layer homology domain-containing protein [Paenibacillus chondroitinus]|uniref:S-layer homology domain-containing protein n=1 Tax=Paenibacillus chondroitinus TaxID=59842 RepID=A0ABU6D9F2_9BACL|nr:S-layer homology domain-containing protein [Paenibacillus chondroitinus]MCY9656720.1 S-layer homology domain-containing protein [Paenibacillus anseongense]MEB4794369.1 S-layer homology domain-containing protein [Paenibacillus chondroitinus]